MLSSISSVPPPYASVSLSPPQSPVFSQFFSSISLSISPPTTPKIRTTGRREQMHVQESICDICGDIGVDCAILTCAQCKINCEHMYCMRVPLEQAVDDWICEECEFICNPEPQASSLLGEVSKINSIDESKSGAGGKILQNESRVGWGSGNWEKRVEKGKTKYLSVQEAIKLSSGEKSSAPVKFNWRSKPNGPETVPVNFFAEQDIASGSSQKPKLHRPGNMEICKKHAQQSTKLTGGNIHTTNEQRIVDAEKMSTTVLPDLEKRSHCPAMDALWKGSFRINDNHRREELNPQIHAHPPTRVRKKIYEFSKKIPQELHFQLVNAKTFWANLFGLNGNYFLWGVFHRVRNGTTTCSGKKVLEMFVNEATQMDNLEEVDMDIDMIGGTEVGRVDAAVGKKPLGGIPTSFKGGESTAPPVSSRPDPHRSAVSVFYPVTTPPLNVEMDLSDHIPPGFEEINRLRLQGFSF